MDTSERDRLRQMLLDRSMRFGDFVLSSGAHSNYYIDVRKTSLHPEGLRWISKLFFEALKADNVTAIGGLTLGVTINLLGKYEAKLIVAKSEG